MDSVLMVKSRIRQGLLGLLFRKPVRRYYLSELARLVETSPGNVQRELRKFFKEGLVIQEKQGKLTFYSVNPQHPCFPELQALILKTLGLEGILHSYFQVRPEVEFAYLFGSQATGQTHRLSDIDVAILADPSGMEKVSPYGYKAEICTDLMKRLKTNRVDVVLLKEASLFLRHQVVKSGKCVFARDPMAQIRFEAEVMERYPDLKQLFQPHRALRKAA